MSCLNVYVAPSLTDHNSEPLPDPTTLERLEGEQEKHAEKRKNLAVQAEFNAVTCIAVYMLLMSFAQKGIDKLRDHLETMQMRDPDGEYEVSEGFDEGKPPYIRFILIIAHRLS